MEEAVASARPWLLRVIWVRADDMDADLVSRVGFWICSAVAAFQILNWWGQGALTGPAFSFAFYFVGACGVRSRSWLAASLLLAWHLLGQAGDFVLGLHNYGFPMVVTLLLAWTVRSAWLASQLQKPSRFEELAASALPGHGLVGASDRLVLGTWTALKWPFLSIAIGLIVLSAYGTVMAIHDPASAVAIEDGATVKK